MFIDLVKGGYDRYPLTNPNFYNNNQIFYDKVYNLKSFLII